MELDLRKELIKDISNVGYANQDRAWLSRWVEA